MIHLLLNNHLLSGTDAVEHIGLVVVVSVDTGSQELLLGVGVLLESLRESEDGVGGSTLELRPGREGRHSACLSEGALELLCHNFGKHDN